MVINTRRRGVDHALTTLAPVAFDAEMRFRARAAHGDAKAGLALLDRLDTAFRKG